MRRAPVITVVVRPLARAHLLREGDPTSPDDKLIDLSNLDWFDVWDGDGYYVQIDPRDPKIIYAEAQEAGLAPRGLRHRQDQVAEARGEGGKPRFRFNWKQPRRPVEARPGGALPRRQPPLQA